jgi:hypothetical protein
MDQNEFFAFFVLILNEVWLLIGFGSCETVFFVVAVTVPDASLKLSVLCCSVVAQHTAFRGFVIVDSSLPPFDPCRTLGRELLHDGHWRVMTHRSMFRGSCRIGSIKTQESSRCAVPFDFDVVG